MSVCKSCKSKNLETDEVTGNTFCSSCGIVQEFDNYQQQYGGISGPQGTFVRLGTAGSGTNYSYKERKLFESSSIIEEITFCFHFSDARTREVKTMADKITEGEFGIGNWFSVLVGASCYIVMRLDSKKVKMTTFPISEVAGVVGCELYELGKMVNRVVKFLGLELPEFNLVGLLERVIRGFKGFSGVDVEKVDLMVKQGAFVIQCAIKWYLTTGRRPGPMAVAVLVFVAAVNGIVVKIEDVAMEVNVAVSTCRMRYKELLEALVEVVRGLPWGKDVNVKNIVKNAPFVMKYMEMRSMDSGGTKRRKVEEERGEFDLENVVGECLNREVNYGIDYDSENGLGRWHKTPDGDNLLEADSGNLGNLIVSHEELAKIYSKFKADVANCSLMDVNEVGHYGDRLSGQDLHLFDEWWSGRSELSERLMLKQLLEKDVGLDSYPPSYIRGFLAVKRRKEKIRAAKVRISSIVCPSNDISKDGITTSSLDTQPYSSVDLCTLDSNNSHKKRRKQNDDNWEDSPIASCKRGGNREGALQCLVGCSCFQVWSFVKDNRVDNTYTQAPQVFLNEGFRNLARTQKLYDVRCVSGDNAMSSLSGGAYHPGISLQKEATSSLYSEFLGRNAPLPNEWRYATGNTSDSFFVEGEHLKYVEDSSASLLQEEQLTGPLADNTDVLLEPTIKEPSTILDNVTDSAANVPDAFSVDTDSLLSSADGSENALSQMNESVGALISEGGNALSSSSVTDSTANVPDAFGVDTDSLLTSADGSEDALSQMNKSVAALVSKGGNALSTSVDNVTSTITGIIKDGNEAIENLTSKVLSSVNQTGELTGNRLENFPSELKEVSSKAGVIALDLLRKTVVVVEDSLVRGSKFVYYSYESSKEFLPPEIQDALISFEKKTNEISRPVGMVFLQVYSAIEGLERSLGLDPSDPIVPFVLFLGTTSTLWTIYWVVTYSGYAGDLSPEVAFELLLGKDDTILVDVRPEDLRERDGIPDLRRAARFRYVHVSLPKVESSLRKLMKSSGDLDDTLIATVIRNLKNVRDRSKIIVMDADGSRVKGIARSLRKLGIKRPYVLQGGFQYWAKQGLRVKDLKPETAVTILNEEAEAILEELSPTPAKILGIGVGSVAALYGLVEWEKTLQLIGVIAIAQTIYRRLASYEDPEDFRKDMRLLLSPVTLGAQAVSWAAKKVEKNGNGLPLSPSSSDVQNRVLQAAAKHESQPLDSEKSQDSLLDSNRVGDENVDVSEA